MQRAVAAVTTALPSPDVGTVTVLMLITSTLVLGLNWRIHPRIAGTGAWCFAHITFIAAAVLLELRGVIPDVISIVLGNGLLAGGSLWMLRGTCDFAGVAFPKGLAAGVMAAVVLGSAYFYLIDPSYLARWWILGPSMALLSGWSLLVPQRRVARQEGVLGVGLLALATLTEAVVLLYVPAGLTWRETGVQALADASAYKAWGLAMGAIVLATQAFGLVLMTANRLQRDLQRQALADALTGLPNRRAFDETLRQVLARSRRSGEAIGLLLVDVDHFKRINDTHGHDEGDEVLREVSRRVVGALRSVDLVARVGGEEFAAILHDPRSGAIRELAERVRLHVSATPVRIVREAVPVTVSVGVAHMTAPPDDAARVLYRAADEALYAAKRGGRDRIEVVDEVSASAIVAAPRTPGWAVR